MLNIDIEVIERLNSLNSQIISLNEKINEDDDEELQDKLESDINIEEDVISSSLSTEILEAFKMADLNEGEFYILTRRYSENRETIETIAKHLGISFQRVQQLEKTALEKLKKPIVAKKLYAYYKDDNLDVTIKLKGNFLEYFEGNFFKVLYLISNLAKEDKYLLYSLYEEETLNKCIKSTNDDSFIDLIYKIKNKLPKTENKNINNLLTYFSEYNKVEVLKEIEKLCITDRSLLFSFYNKEYSLVKPLTESDLRNIKPILDKINKRLLKEKMNFILNTKNLLKYLNLTKEEIMEILIDYPKYKEVIMHFYNEDLTDYNFVNDNNYMLFYNILNSLKEISKSIYNNLVSKLKVPSNIINEKVSLLRAKYRRIITKVYNNDFFNGNTSILSEEEKTIFKEAIKELKELLKGTPKIEVNIKDYENLLIYFNIDKITLLESLNSLDKEKLTYLKNIYNEDFTKIINSNIDIYKLNEILQELKIIIINKIILKNNNEEQLLTYLGIENQEFTQILDSLTSSEREMLNKRYKANFTKFDKRFKQENLKYIKEILNKIKVIIYRKRLIEKLNNEKLILILNYINICENTTYKELSIRFNISESLLKEILSSYKEKDIIYLELIKKIK